jgi:hypothetical protein
VIVSPGTRLEWSVWVVARRFGIDLKTGEIEPFAFGTGSWAGLDNANIAVNPKVRINQF